MHSLQTIGREIIGLFVEDLRFTAALAFWIAAAGAMRWWLDSAAWVGAAVLFAGFALILIAESVDAARRK